MKIFLLISVLFLTEGLVAQTNESAVVLHQDSRVDSLYKALEPKIDRVPKPQSERAVYRLMIDSIKNREVAYRLKSELADAYGQKQQVYISFWDPFFKIKLGDFLSKDSAASFRKDFFKKFKLNTTIIPDIQTLLWKCSYRYCIAFA